VSAGCTAVLDLLDRRAPEAEVELHLRGCADCRRWYETHRALGSLAAPAPPGPAAAIHERARAELIAHPRATPWWRDALFAAGAALAVAAVGVLMVGGHGLVLNSAPAVAIALAAAALLAALAVTAYAAFAPGPHALWTAPAAAAAAAALLAAGSGAYPDWCGPYWEAGLRCARSELVFSILPAAVALALLRRFAFSAPRALAAGLGAGIAGLLVLHLHCAIGTASHIGPFHLLPWLVVAVLFTAARRLTPTLSFAR
jgi:hypothetical protein